ncbi:MAG: hypothetical protein ACJ76Z_08355 [Thermoleophilaceae bacterium]
MAAFRRLRTRLTREEDGWVVVVAVVVMVLMVGVGLAILKLVDTQQAVGKQSRVRESSFNVSEGLLTNEAQILQHNWPRQATCTGNLNGCAYVSNCTEAAVNPTTNPSNQCPNRSELLGTNAAFNNVDQNATAATTWKLQVRDDTGAVSGTNPAYTAAVRNNPSWDENGNKQVWVRVDAVVRGKTRSLVELLQLEKLSVPFNGGALTAGSINFTNAGNKTIVDTTNSPPVVVRCQDTPSTTLSLDFSAGQTVAHVDGPATQTALFVPTMNVDILPQAGGSGETLTVQLADPVAETITFTSVAQSTHVKGSTVSFAPGTANTCERWNGGQLQPPYNYISQPGFSTGLQPADITLIEDGSVTYPPGTCPSSTVAAWTGPIVIKQAPAAGCSMATSGNVSINNSNNPGFVIVEDQVNPATASALTIPNNTTFFGVVYMLNLQGAGTPGTPGSFNPVLSLGANAQVCGGVAIDGGGGIFIGSANNGNSAGCGSSGSHNGATIVYDKNAFTAFGAAGAAGLVQNTWRELAPGQ